MSNWSIRTIAECASAEPYSTQIGPFGEKIRAENYTATGAPVLRGTNVNPEGRFHDDDFVFIDPGLAESEFNKFVCEADDVILCHKGTLGRIGIIPKQSRYKQYIMGNSMMKVRCDPSKLDPLYLYYWLCSRDGQHYLFSRVSQVGVPQIQRPLSTLREATLPVPPLAEQKAIAAVLGALDDKIELNRRMNATLEAMARALFQSWFVDFDPVRVKLDGRQPAGLDPAIAALFPNEFVPSDVGPIPKGWRIMKVADFIKRLPVGQKYDQTMVVPIGAVPVLDQGKSGIIGYHNDKPGVTASLDTPVAVFANHTCYMRLITYSFSAIQNVLPFIGSGVDTCWAYYATEGRLAFSEYKGHWPDFVIQEANVPPRELTNQFGHMIRPLIAQIRSNEKESWILISLRDALLPKLLSGALRVGNSTDE